MHGLNYLRCSALPSVVNCSFNQVGPRYPTECILNCGRWLLRNCSLLDDEPTVSDILLISYVVQQLSSQWRRIMASNVRRQVEIGFYRSRIGLDTCKGHRAANGDLPCKTFVFVDQPMILMVVAPSSQCERKAFKVEASTRQRRYRGRGAGEMRLAGFVNDCFEEGSGNAHCLPAQRR